MGCNALGLGSGLFGWEVVRALPSQNVSDGDLSTPGVKNRAQNQKPAHHDLRRTRWAIFPR